VAGAGSLPGFIARGVLSWVAFSFRHGWPLLFVAATLGTLLLRPWLAPVGFVTTAVSWLMGGVAQLPHQDLHWSNRAIAPLVFWWCVMLLGFASLRRWAAPFEPGRRRRLAQLGGVIVAACVAVQLAFSLRGWDAIDLNLLRPSPFSAAERAQANALFAVYRREARPDEPVAASPALFRYAHDRNLFWLDRLAGRPRPIWILQDGSWAYTDFGLRGDDYQLVGRQGRFALFKRRAD
jgi:hypothetical protein